MLEKQRKLHPEQRSTNPTLLANQQRLLWEQWSNDVEIYTNDGELVAITARDNPNLSEVLAHLRDQYDAPGDTR
jgi:hypothetical protein